MKIFKYPISQAAFAVLALALAECSAPQADPNAGPHTDSTQANVKAAKNPDAQDNALPFTMRFVRKTFSGAPLPALQSYVLGTTSDGQWLVIGGRTQGLHTFKSAPDTNFLPAKSNHIMYVIDPVSGQSWSFDVNNLSAELSAPLQATNHQAFQDGSTGQLYISGGYGWKADKSDMTTFNTMIRLNVDKVAAAVKSGASPQSMAQLFEVAHDDRFAVTGGELFKMNGNFYLVFGQNFKGQYRAFGGTDFTQKYVEQIAVFNFLPNSLKINSYGTIPTSDPDHPFHRRDGNTFEDIDPATAKPRITAMGGVFKPGIIAAYTYPIYITNPGTPVINKNANQKFCQYECPVISVYDANPSGKAATYNTFFGGIGRWYYFQTDSQKAIYDTATVQGRNDGFPFVEDITTWVQTADGQYSEFIQTSPVPDNRLLGASASFILNPGAVAAGYTFENGVIQLQQIPAGQNVLIGYVYGGIEAEFPLPYHPNGGTYTSNAIFEVYINTTPSPAIPADKGHESVTNNQNLLRK